MIPAHIVEHRRRMDEKLVSVVSAKLGARVSLKRWDVERRTGAEIPVFSVPHSLVAAAQALGLTAEESE